MSKEVHSQFLLFFVSKFCKVLSEVFSYAQTFSTTESIISIEKLDSDEWYWDIQVPNTKNYVSNGMVHHNSSKSILAAHLIVKHALKYPRARIGIGRRSLPDVKATIFNLIVEHLEDPHVSKYVESITTQSAIIKLKNGSMIEAISWADKKYKKFRSRVYSLLVYEEAVENKGDDVQAFIEGRQRVGRLPHIKENLILYLTNPDSRQHYLYDYFFNNPSPTKHIYKSLTEENPFLPKTYVEKLKKDLPPKEARRMLYGEWGEIDTERIYYAYDIDSHYIKKDYQLVQGAPISLSFDFNIGAGKPMSCVLSQYILATDTFHFFDEVSLHGSRTLSVMEELAEKCIFDLPFSFEIHGDATGGARSTNSLLSNYEIIKQFLDNYKTKTGQKLNYIMRVPKSNPPIKERHNIVNAYCLNMLGQRRLYVYEKCKMLNQGMQLTALKKGAQYIEDDSNEWQHSTTALGYRVVYTSKNKVITKGSNI